MPYENTSQDLSAALEAEEDLYTVRNPTSREMFGDAGSYLPGGISRLSLYFDPFPLFLANAQGSVVEDADGHEYVDFSNDLTAALYGHSDPAILAALRNALEKGISYGGLHEHEVELGKEICRRFPSIDRVRFCNSGTEANLVAMKLSRIATDRHHVIAFKGGYHGSLCNYLMPDGNLNVEADSLLFATFNDAESVGELVGRHGDSIASIIVEPMMGSGGGILASREFLGSLRAIADRTGTLLIFDEVQTARFAGGGMQSIFGIPADITTLGKFCGGGLNFGAVGGRAEILDRLSPLNPSSVMHGGTFNNNVLTMIAGHTGFTKIATQAGLEKLNALGDDLRRQLSRIAEARSVPFAAGCYGSILSLHFQDVLPTNPAEIVTSPRVRKLYHHFMLNRGIYVTRRGAINLSFAHNSEDCRRILERFEQFLDTYGHLVQHH